MTLDVSPLRKQTITPRMAQAERARREQARRHLCNFGEYVYSWWTPYAMHQMIAQALERVLLYLKTDGREGTKLQMILTPPQHGKSVETSVLMAGLALGQIPDLRVFLISYGADLAVTNSRAVRSLVLSDEYQAIYGSRSATDEPVMLSSDSRASSAWDLAQPHRGGVVATGINGSISGRAKGLAIIDDPIKNHKEAQSADVREDAWEFWLSSIRPRAKAAILIMTHWHPDDPAGRFMREMVANPKADQWEILMLPALAFEQGEYAASKEEQLQRMREGVYLPMADPLGRQPGEALCPAMMSREELLTTRETDDYYFTSLYQQLPYSKVGQAYKRNWFQIIPKIHDDVKLIHLVRYWDKANSTSGDYTAGVLMGYGSNGYFYLLDVVRGRWKSYERNQKMLKTAKDDCEKYGNVKIWHQQDPGSAGKDSAEATNQLLKGYPAKFKVVTGDKEDRSDPLEDVLGKSEIQESALQGGLMFLLRGAWNEAFINECVAFPGPYDDQVDAASSAYSKLLEMIGSHRKSRVQ